MTIRQSVCLTVIAAGAIVLVAPPAAAPASGWRAALDRLAEEKTLAESCAAILKSSAVDHPMARVQGERLYGRAEADANGLIAMLAVDLGDSRSPADVPELRHRLETVPRQRQALCRQVRAALSEREPTPRGLVALLDRGSDAAPGSLLGAALELWQAYRRGDAARRRAIAAALGAGRWLPYAEVPGHGPKSATALRPAPRTGRAAGRTGRRP